MRLTLAYLMVFAAAATPWLEVLLVVPAALVAGLPPVPVVLVAAVGNIATLVPVVYAGEWVRSRLAARRGEGADGHRQGGRARRVMDRYGLPGLAALGPLLGIHVAALVATAAG
jgi:hypothetical protein